MASLLSVYDKSFRTNNNDNTPTLSTMAELVALRTALTCMGFTTAVASFITDTQGMNDLEEFLLLDDEGVGTLCKAIRRPGGQIPNPAFAAARTVAAADPRQHFQPRIHCLNSCRNQPQVDVLLPTLQ